MSLNSYPSIYNFGHRVVVDILKYPVLIEEKVDGSQFSFGIDYDGNVLCRSKGQQIVLDEPGMFASGVATAQGLAANLQLVPGWVYRGEFLSKPKHNTLAYDRTPYKNIILYDVNTGEECYLPRSSKEAVAKAMGLEVVPLLFEGLVQSADQLLAFLDRESVLGGQKIEGVVVKPANYNLFGPDKKLILAKFVSAEFKEKHQKDWKAMNPKTTDVVTALGDSLRTEMRWRKSVQHLREEGALKESPQDIGNLIRAVAADVLKEEREYIEQVLFKWAWPQIQRKVVAGLPEWYKLELAKAAYPALDEEVPNE